MVWVKEKNVNIMNNKPKAYIVSVWQTGMGDMYSNILNCYYTKKDLESMGYEVFLVKNIVTNLYFNSSYPNLICEIFDFSPFGENVIFNNFDIEKTHINIEQQCHSYRIYVERKLDGIDNYQIDFINSIACFKEKKYDFVSKEPQFLNKNILDEMENFLSFTDGDLSGVSLRIGDGDLSNPDIFETERYQPVIKELKDFLKSCSSKHIFLSTSNMSEKFIKQLKELDDRFFIFKFTHNFPMHWVCYANDFSDKTDEFLRHTKEIAINMSCFSRCKNIAQICGYPSAFMCYGLYHNINYSKPTETFSHFKYVWL